MTYPEAIALYRSEKERARPRREARTKAIVEDARPLMSNPAMGFVTRADAITTVGNGGSFPKRKNGGLAPLAMGRA